MNIPGVVSPSPVLSNGGVQDAVQMAVLKKGMEIEEQNAMQLVEAARQVGSSNPSHLGNGVDVYA